MALDFSAEVSRDISLLNRLLRFLRNLSGYDPTVGERIKERTDLIDGQLSELRAVDVLLRQLDGHEARLGRTESSAQQRQQLVKRIVDVQVFCDSGLAPLVKPLMLDLAQPDTAALEKMLQEVDARSTAEHPWQEHSSVEAFKPSTARSERETSHVGMEQIPLDTPAAPGASSGRETFDREPEQTRSVAVSSTLLESLNSHQQRLEGYIKGYMLCQELSNRCEVACQTFDEARTRGLKAADWERVRRSLNEISTKVNELGPRLRFDIAEFEELLGRVETAVREARLLIQEATELEVLDPAAEPATLVRKLTKMRYGVDEIVALCPSRAEATLGELRDVISQIFGEIGRQREARRYAKDSAAGRTFKLPTEAPAGVIAQRRIVQGG